MTTAVATSRKRPIHIDDAWPSATAGEPAAHEGGGRVTREIGVRELRDTASQAIDRIAGGERAIVTRRSEPVAVILSIEESLEFVLTHAEDFVRARRLARAEQRGE